MPRTTKHSSDEARYTPETSEEDRGFSGIPRFEEAQPLKLLTS